MICIKKCIKLLPGVDKAHNNHYIKMMISLFRMQRENKLCIRWTQLTTYFSRFQTKVKTMAKNKNPKKHFYLIKTSLKLGGKLKMVAWLESLLDGKASITALPQTLRMLNFCKCTRRWVIFSQKSKRCCRKWSRRQTQMQKELRNLRANFLKSSSDLCVD